MNLPNKITVARILFIPLMIIIPFFGLDNILFGGVTLGNFIVLIIFLIASFTDFLDGYLARKNNIVTTFGKFLDPIADKLLVLAALIMLVEQGIVPGWIPIIIAAREFIVSGIRMLAAGEGNVIAASWLGKVKTVSQMVAISLAFLGSGAFMAWTKMQAMIYELKVDPENIYEQAGYPLYMNVPVGLNVSWVINLLMSIAMLVAVGTTIWSGIDYFMKSKEVILKSK